MQKKDTCQNCSYSAAKAVVDRATTPKMRFTTKLYFWLFVLLTILSVFLFWSQRGKAMTPHLIAGIIAVCMATFFGLICLVRFIRARSITGGLFLTTCISTGVFLGTSQMLPIIVPPTAAAFSASPDTTNNGFQLLVALAQVGLFAVWFGFLLFTIFLYVQPVKRIDRYLQRVINGDKIRRVRIGKAKQYKGIEEKIKLIASGAPPEANDSSSLVAETS